MPWEVNKLKQGDRSFVVVGCGYRLHGEVWQGAMKNDVFWGLKALELPSCRSRLLRRWEANVPRAFGNIKNTGAERKIIVFSSDSGTFVLRFEETVPPELLRDLRIAFGGTPQKEKRDEKPAREPELDPAGTAVRRGPGGGDDQDRHAPGAGKDPRHRRLAKGVKVRRPPAKKRKKSHANP